ncbi:arginine utilization protein RocB [Bacillus mesophilus]|uniref:M20/M25/M40 family metallo-hydrolase n=1 Tax=Bacillus mesophilus TaxID=1808955 RepID=A0A6M0Q5B9_9BACI|nr:M20/M25/M40 family metallo-hydrolase [Bacillus mesophilus]MBM7660976.1 arginine utilization protein RocB [Bacillus mesophilus]NEY71482.1 M20/M25/M40 family metallo-hydrolase [Bacillus mesophilus]
MLKWQSKDQLVALLSKLVGCPSVTGKAQEVEMAKLIHSQLQELSYFKENQGDLRLHEINDGRLFVTALVKKPNVKKTIVLLSHFDVVEVEDYGTFKDLAFNPKALTEEYKKNKHLFASEVQAEIESGDWLFGRGAMDMKAGLALQMSMIERAANGQFDGNLLLLSVPDEEVNSAGMIGAVPALVELADTHDLQYVACLNSEPMFSKYPGDENYYMYTGSIGKVLPGFLSVGKETHVGEPFSGLNANLMASEVTRVLELNTDFCEVVDGEVTPPPTSLMQRDLKQEYSVKIPYTAVSLYNVLFMKRSLTEMTDLLLQQVKTAAENIEGHYSRHVEQYSKLEDFSETKMKVNIFTYEQLLQVAVEKHGKEEIKKRQMELVANRTDEDDREFSTRMVEDLAILCKELSPMIVLFYSPPYYPSVLSSDVEVISTTKEELIAYAKEKYNIKIKSLHYFSGLSDLSFVGLRESGEELQPLLFNMPLFKKGYHLPIKELEKLQVPVLNVGPFGKDPHQWTERLHVPISFGMFPDLISKTINTLLNK